jgi:hypothetical protein
MSMLRRRAIFVTAASLLCVHTIGAVAANLVTNPDFDINLNGWTIGDISGGNGPFATFALNSTDGLPTAPSAEFTTSLNQFSAATSDCMAIDTSQNVDLYANAKIILGNVLSTGASVAVYMFSDMSCGSLVGPQIVNQVHGSLGAWQQISSPNFPLLAGTHSVRIVLEVLGGSPGQPGIGDVLFDHIVFQQTATTPVRLQSFEVK